MYVFPTVFPSISPSDPRKDIPKYRVRWSGYTEVDDCWMDESDLQYGRSHFPLWSNSDPLTRCASEVVDEFWKSRLPEVVFENRRAVLGLFSETRILADIEALKSSSRTQPSCSSMDDLSKNLAFRYANQSTISQSFAIDPHSADNVSNWTDVQMARALNNIVCVVNGIPEITDQATKLRSLLRASEWDCTRAYYLAFFWFNGTGSRLALASVSQFQALNGIPTEATPLQRLTCHVILHVRAVMRNLPGESPYCFSLSFSALLM